jgi:glucose-1-phosphate cytidylyltransferase
MKAVILAGGYGTRLSEETVVRPKPMVEIGGKPILWHIMKIYGHHDLKRFIVCLGYKSWLIKQFFLNYREQISDFTLRLADSHEPRFHNGVADEDWEITCAETGQVAGTGTRLYRVRRYIDTDTFMFTYGDGIGRVNLEELLDFHYEHGRIGTVTGVHPTSRYGELRVEGRFAVAVGAEQRDAVVGVDAEDMVQECLIKAYRAYPDLRDVGAAPAWLRQILLNCCRDHLRSASRLPTDR